MEQPTYELVHDVTGKPSSQDIRVLKINGEEIKVPHPPKVNCKKCYGKGYIGVDHNKKVVFMCHKCYPPIKK